MPAATPGGVSSSGAKGSVGPEEAVRWGVGGAGAAFRPSPWGRGAARAPSGAARSVATHAARGIDAARPVYEAGKPVLHHLGINTAIADKALNHYDGIRRALGR